LEAVSGLAHSFEFLDQGIAGREESVPGSEQIAADFGVQLSHPLQIAYEAIVAAAAQRAPSEPLLVPQIVELDAARSVALDRALEALREGGLEVEAFGERTYRIVATPAGYGSRRFDLGGMLDDLSEDPKQRDVRERVWATLACHSVTVAGEPLAMQEMSTLVERLQRCANPMHCPHGRPTMVRLSPDELARMFKRV